MKHFSFSVKILTFLLRDKTEFNDYGKILSVRWEVIHEKTREVFVSFPSDFFQVIYSKEII